MAEQRKKHKGKKPQAPKAIPVSAPPADSILKFLLPVLGITTAVFIPVFANDFTNWDDAMYVTDNALLKDLGWDGIKAIFSTPIVSNYHPLTVLSLAVNYHISGIDAWSYQLTNLILHVANTGFVFWLVMLLSRRNHWVSAFTALIFGIHPMHVESVAWMSERKDLLYTIFYLLAMIVYVKYLERKETKSLIIVTLLAALSLLSKPAAIVLPLSLLLVDYYFKRPWNWRWIIEKIPIFLLSGVMAYVTVLIQAQKAIVSVDLYNFLERICFAGYGILWYILKFFFPYPLSALHPFPDGLPWHYYVVTIISILAFIFFILKVRNRNYQFGIGFYIINLLLVLQLVSIGNAVVAERYTYVPYIGLAFLVGMEVFLALHHKLARYKGVFIGIAVAWILLLCIITVVRIPVWKNSEILWSDVLKNYPESAKGWTNKGLIYYETKEWQKVIDHLSNGLKYDPTNPDALEWRARTYLELKEGEKALADAERYYQLYPDKVDALFILGSSYEAAGRANEALEAYNKLIERIPYVPDYLNNRGTILFNYFKRYEEARNDFEKAIQLRPTEGLYYLNNSRCYYMMGKMEIARQNVLKAKELGTPVDPAYAAQFGL